MAIESRFAKYMTPVIDALKALGGSARPGEVFDWIADRLNISDEERDISNQDGTSRFENDVAWCRFYLARTGYLDSSKRGVWSLTEKGSATALSDEEVYNIIREVTRHKSSAREVVPTAEPVVPAEQIESSPPADVPRNYRERALQVMQALPPSGFERLCQRLMRESGFQQVKVTGRSGDGGIDGIGVLQVNPFVSFKVLFQCKRWANAVGPAVVRDFRGAMMGRADKGLILSTGTFTAEAQAEAVRDGVSPIELVDGQALITLLEQLELGLVPRTTYEVDERFFEEFAR